MSGTISLVTGILIPVCAIIVWWGILRTRSSVRPHEWPSLGHLIVIVVIGLNLAIGTTLQFILEGETVILELAIFGWAFTAWAAWLTWRRHREKGVKQKQATVKAQAPAGVCEPYVPPLLVPFLYTLAVMALGFPIVALVRGGLEPVVYVPLVAAYILGPIFGYWVVLSFLRRRRSANREHD